MPFAACVGWVYFPFPNFNGDNIMDVITTVALKGHHYISFSLHYIDFDLCKKLYAIMYI